MPVIPAEAGIRGFLACYDMKKSPILIVVAFLAGLAGAWVFQSKNATDKPAHENTYDRVMRTQTLRCGYAVWTPFLLKDPNTGKLSGLFYDYTQALGEILGLKIEWTEEVSWGEFPAALDAGRIDAMCGGAYPNAARARVIDFVRPILYQPIYVYARAGDTRFDHNHSIINDASITLTAVEGSMVGRVAVTDFPKAKAIMLPELTSLAETFVNVASRKADVTVSNSATAEEYMANNPGKMRRVAGKPLHLAWNSIAIPGGQYRFRQMLDIATEELIANGQIETIIAKHEKFPDTLLRPALPYRSSSVH
ncbi:MAG: transporter substrate-binding domain-containing protein [Alphaproteobacteria bacterium]|nr:transporter substrate-binding domain-containing protein [Alphaproteobacteria bacterium]